MKEDQSSRSAERVAMQRAAHQIIDDPRIFEDSIALQIIGRQAASRLLDGPEKIDSIPWSRHLRAFVVARSRYAEDELARAMQGGVRQYIILGAGLDTFAYRCTASGLRVFEVDHPATQAWKRTRLRDADIALPEFLTFAPVNFEDQTIEEGLRKAGFDTDQPSFFSWLGVTPYLSKNAAMATLGFIASALPRGSEIVFDYMSSPDLLNPARRSNFEAMAARVAAAGEPWISFFEPPSLVSELGALGFREITDVGSDELNARYFRNRKDGLKIGGLGHLIRAQV